MSEYIPSNTYETFLIPVAQPPKKQEEQLVPAQLLMPYTVAIGMLARRLSLENVDTESAKELLKQRYRLSQDSRDMACRFNLGSNLRAEVTFVPRVRFMLANYMQSLPGSAASYAEDLSGLLAEHTKPHLINTLAIRERLYASTRRGIAVLNPNCLPHDAGGPDFKSYVVDKKGIYGSFPLDKQLGQAAILDQLSNLETIGQIVAQNLPHFPVSPYAPPAI